MRKLLFASLPLLVASTVLTPLALANGDFEKGSFDGWGGFWGETTEVTTAAGRTGSGAHILVNGSTQGGLYQDVAGAVGGDRVQAGISFAVPAGEALSGDAKYVLRLEVTSEQGADLGTFDKVLASADLQPAVGAWTSETFEITAPAGTFHVRYVLLLEAPSKQKVGLYADGLTLSIVKDVPDTKTEEESGCSTGVSGGFVALALAVIAGRRRRG